MLSLSYIQGIDDDAVSLLNSIGVEDATQLSEHTSASLATLLNSKKSGGKLPGIDDLEDWISQANLITGTLSSKKGDDSDVEVVEAVELDEAELEAEAIDLDDEIDEDEDLDDIPEVVILEEDEDSEGIHVVELPEKSYHKNEELAYWRKVRGLDKDFGGTEGEGEPDDIWKDVNPSSFNSFNDYRDGKVGVKPLVDKDDVEEFARIKRMKHRVEEKGAKPDFGDKGNISRWVRRGVQHPAPFLVWITGLFVVLARLYVLALIIFLPFAVIEKGNQFKETVDAEGAVTTAVNAWSPGAILDNWWWLMFGILVLVGWLYLWSVLRVRCRVCSCQLYYSSRAYKHVKAHRLRPMGYVFALGLHAVVFRWFRCMYCGTAIRLQESAHTQKEQTIDAPAIEVEDQEEGVF